MLFHPAYINKSEKAGGTHIICSHSQGRTDERDNMRNQWLLKMKDSVMHPVKCFLYQCCVVVTRDRNQAIELALEAILGHRSAHSLATGPVMADPFISPLLLTITPALSSKQMNCPSFLLNVFLWRMTTAGITFLRSSGLPFLTVARTQNKYDKQLKFQNNIYPPETN